MTSEPRHRDEEGQRDTPPRGGVPASDYGNPLADLMAPDFDDRPRGAHFQMLDEALKQGRRRGPAKQIEERWVEEPGTLHGGHWERSDGLGTAASRTAHPGLVD